MKISTYFKGCCVIFTLLSVLGCGGGGGGTGGGAATTDPIPLNVWISQTNYDNCPVNIIEVSVSDNHGALTSLIAGNFTLTHNGTPVPITAFTNNPSAPVSLVLTLDGSSSMKQRAPDLITAATSFINQLTNEDEAAICKFESTQLFYPAVAPLFVPCNASGKSELIDHLGDQVDPGYQTKLYDAVYASIARATQGNVDKQRAVVVFSDGIDGPAIDDPYSSSTLSEVIQYASSQNIPVFTIHYAIDSNTYEQGREALQRLAEETGGQYYMANDYNVTDIFQGISDILVNTYTIAYTSPNSECSGTISLSVRVDWNGTYGQDSREIIMP